MHCAPDAWRCCPCSSDRPFAAVAGLAGTHNGVSIFETAAFSLLIGDGRIQPVSPATLAGAAALVVSLRWKNLTLSIISGLVAYACLDLVM